MRYAVLALFVLSCAVYAKQRTETVRVVKTETTVAATPDSTRLAWEDTLKITTTYRDTSIVVKIDTVKTASAARIVPKTAAKK
jgi:predicted metal-dependent TIM-barrel fold hydrolase